MPRFESWIPHTNKRKKTMKIINSTGKKWEIQWATGPTTSKKEIVNPGDSIEIEDAAGAIYIHDHEGKDPRVQDIILENGIKCYINHDSKQTCLECEKEILYAAIPIELVGLAKWDLHKCKEKQ